MGVAVEDLWIVIPNWDKFQHYKDRDPVWIKLYVELNRRDDWRRLTLAERGLLVSIWIEYCASGCRLRVKDVGSRVRTKLRQSTLVSLNDAGFIQLSASAPIALARSREKRREEKKETPHFDNQKTDNGPVNPRYNMPPRDETAYVRALIANHVITEPYELDAFDLTDDLRAELRALL